MAISSIDTKLASLQSQATGSKTATKVSSDKVSGEQSRSRPIPSGNAEHLSADWRQLSDAQEELASLNDVDMDKVAAIRQQIAEGSFDIDLDAIADGMLNQHGR